MADSALYRSGSEAMQPRPAPLRRSASLRRHDAAGRRVAGDLQHQLGAGRLLELLALLDLDHERARAADDAILVIDVEVGIGGVAVGPLHHDRQAVDGDAGLQYLVAHQRDRRAHVVDAIARYVDHAAQAVEAGGVEQGFCELERAEDRGAWRPAVGGTLDLLGSPLGALDAVDQAPRHDDLLVVETGPFEIGHCNTAVRTAPQRRHEFARRQPGDVALALQGLFLRVHRIGHVDSYHEFGIDGEGIGAAVGEFEWQRWRRQPAIPANQHDGGHGARRQDRDQRGVRTHSSLLSELPYGGTSDEQGKAGIRMCRRRSPVAWRRVRAATRDLPMPLGYFADERKISAAAAPLECSQAIEFLYRAKRNVRFGTRHTYRARTVARMPMLAP